MPVIRPATPDDAERVMQIWRDAVDATHHFLKPEDRNAIEAELSTFLPTAPLWLAVDHTGQTTGFMLLDGCHLEALFIDPLSRGQGVGRALVNHALCLQGDTLLTDVNEQNAQAFGFYRHMGFEPVGRSDLDGQGRPYPLIHLRLGQ